MSALTKAQVQYLHWIANHNVKRAEWRTGLGKAKGGPENWTQHRLYSENETITVPDHVHLGVLDYVSSGDWKTSLVVLNEAGRRALAEGTGR